MVGLVLPKEVTYWKSLGNTVLVGETAENIFSDSVRRLPHHSPL